MREENIHLRHPQERPDTPDVLYRVFLIGMRAMRVASRIYNDRDLLLTGEEAFVVRRIASEKDPRTLRGRASEDVQVPGEMANGVDEVETAISKVVVSARKRADGGIEGGCREEASTLKGNARLEDI